MELPNKDVKFITDETLDFSLLSPLDGQEEDVPVIRPVELNIRCSARAVDTNVLPGESEGRNKEQGFHWSPLSPEKLEEVMKEANMLAAQLEKCRLLEKEDAGSEARSESVSEREPLPLINILQAERGIAQNSRRKTFNVKNSPLQALLPRVGPETSSIQESPKALFSESGSHAACDATPPVCKRLQNKSNSCSSGGQLSKKSRPNQSLRALTVMKSPAVKKSQAAGRSSQKNGPSPLAFQRVSQDQKSPLASVSSLRTNRQRALRRTDDASGKDSSTGDLQLSLQSSSRRSPKPTVGVKEKPGSLCTSPAKRSSAAPEKGMPLRRTHASQAESVGGSGPPRQTNSRIQSSQIQTRRTAASAFPSQLPVARTSSKATGQNTSLSKHTIPGNSSQQKLNVRLPSGKGSAVPGPAGKKASVLQQMAPSAPSQNSRLRLPRKATTENSRVRCSIRQ